MGGNVTVPTGQVVGGDFAHIPACRTNAQTGCVRGLLDVQFATARQQLLRSRRTSISALSGLSPTSAAGLEVLCTNPAALAGGEGSIGSIHPDQTVSRL